MCMLKLVSDDYLSLSLLFFSLFTEANISTNLAKLQKINVVSSISVSSYCLVADEQQRPSMEYKIKLHVPVVEGCWTVGQ